MNYQLSTIQQIFSAIYSPLRRVFSDYLVNYSGRSFFVFASAVIKRSTRIGFYNKAVDAQRGATPDGILPDLSPYYWRELPVSVQDADALVFDLLNGEPVDLSRYKPVLKLTIFTGATYKSVYVPINASIMEVRFFIADAIQMQTRKEQILSLNKILVGNLEKLAVVYNQLLQYKNAQAKGKKVDTAYITRMESYINSALEAYRVDPRYVVKVCKECAGNAQLSGVGSLIPAINFVVTTGALSLQFITGNSFSTEYPNLLRQEKDGSDSREIVLERYLYGFEQKWKQLNDPSYKPVEVDVKPLQTVTVTASKNKNWLWLVLAAAGLAVVSKRKPKTQNK